MGVWMQPGQMIAKIILLDDVQSHMVKMDHTREPGFQEGSISIISWLK